MQKIGEDMRTYKYAIYITCAITLISFCIAFALNFYFTDSNPFWCNLLLGIFGSSSLTLLTSIIGYRVERRRTFEGFSYATKAILHDLNKYQYTWGLEEKVDFFLNYTDISKIDWDRYYGDFDFFTSFFSNDNDRRYIYTQIYYPIVQVNTAVRNHIWHFRWYQDGSGKNDVVIKKFIREIEHLFITDIRNNLVYDISHELNNRYYKLMYGTRAFNRSCSQKS
ncbi:MAG: hypothetical protein ACLVFS_02440 [Butyricicoccus sp.]